MLAKHALSQLSYGPVVGSSVSKRSGGGLAPLKALARGALGIHSLGYRLANEWWAWEDLNFRPHAYQARALTN